MKCVRILWSNVCRIARSFSHFRRPFDFLTFSFHSTNLRITGRSLREQGQRRWRNNREGASQLIADDCLDKLKVYRHPFIRTKRERSGKINVAFHRTKQSDILD